MRIIALKRLGEFDQVVKGDKGGLIEKEENLSQEGDCWVFEDAKVSGNAQVYGDAFVLESACVSGNAKVYGDATVSAMAMVCGNARVFGKACIIINCV